MANVFDYIFNLGGNFSANIKGLTEATGNFQAKIESASGTVGRLTQIGARLDILASNIDRFAQGIQNFSRAGIDLDTQMHDLSAVAGVTGDALKRIEGYARESAKAFGTDASTAVTGYKLLLSQLSPELGKYPEALKAMGNSIQITSKLMGGDGVAVDEYPFEDMCKLAEFLKLNKAFEVFSEFLDIWEISQVVVKKFTLTQQTDSNYQELMLELKSDEDYEIVSTEY